MNETKLDIPQRFNHVFWLFVSLLGSLLNLGSVRNKEKEGEKKKGAVGGGKGDLFASQIL